MHIKTISKNLIKINNKYYATLSKKEGYDVYGEKRIRYKGKEYRVWNPTKSKLAAALHNRMPLSIVKDIESAKYILYLGIANGTTASHIEDLNPSAIVFGVELSPRSIIDLIHMTKNRESNIIPILENAAHPLKYSFMVTKADILYVDIAQPHQTDIALKNGEIFLKKNGLLLIAIKTRSIDIRKKPIEIVKEEIKKIESQGYKILFDVMLNPYEKDHGFVVAIKK